MKVGKSKGNLQLGTMDIIIIIIIYLSRNWATCWPVPVSRIQKSLQRSTKIPSASWGEVFHYPGQRLKVAILPLDLPCSGPVTLSGEILTTGNPHELTDIRYAIRCLTSIIPRTTDSSVFFHVFKIKWKSTIRKAQYSPCILHTLRENTCCRINECPYTWTSRHSVASVPFRGFKPVWFSEGTGISHTLQRRWRNVQTQPCAETQEDGLRKKSWGDQNNKL